MKRKFNLNDLTVTEFVSFQKALDPTTTIESLEKNDLPNDVRIGFVVVWKKQLELLPAKENEGIAKHLIERERIMLGERILLFEKQIAESEIDYSIRSKFTQYKSFMKKHWVGITYCTVILAAIVANIMTADKDENVITIQFRPYQD